VKFVYGGRVWKSIESVDGVAIYLLQFSFDESRAKRAKKERKFNVWGIKNHRSAAVRG